METLRKQSTWSHTQLIVWEIIRLWSVRLFWPLGAKNSLGEFIKALNSIYLDLCGVFFVFFLSNMPWNKSLPLLHPSCLPLKYLLCSSSFLTRWQSPPESTSWMKTAGPSGLLEPPPMVMPRLLDRATEMSWITPSPGWLRTQRTYEHSEWSLMSRRGFVVGFVDPVWASGLQICKWVTSANVAGAQVFVCTTTGEPCGGWCESRQHISYLRERSMGPLLLYMFWEPAGLNNKGLWERDEDPDDVLSR